MPERHDLTTLLERLVETDVELVLVGGLAAVVQGAPLTTFDVDVVHRRTEDNVDRLIAFLAGVGARYRNRPGAPLPPSRSALLGPGHSLFMTDLGPLDVLGAIEAGADYEQLLPESLVVHLGSRPLHVLSLAKIVELKRTSSEPKDKLRLPVLEALLRREKGSSDR
jgi:hypothetical protein